MESSIFKFIVRFSMKQQITVLIITMISLPFYYLSLEIPKKIINRALGTAITRPKSVSTEWIMKQ